MDKSKRNLANVVGIAGVGSAVWAKPVVDSVVLPAHGNTTYDGNTTYECGALTFVGGGPETGPECSIEGAAWADMSSPQAGVELNLSTEYNGSGEVEWTAGPPDGNYFTNGSGRAVSSNIFFFINGAGTLTFTWNFVSSTDGCDTFNTTYTCIL